MLPVSMCREAITVSAIMDLLEVAKYVKVLTYLPTIEMCKDARKKGFRRAGWHSM